MHFNFIQASFNTEFYFVLMIKNKYRKIIVKKKSRNRKLTGLRGGKLQDMIKQQKFYCSSTDIIGIKKNRLKTPKEDSPLKLSM